MTAKVVKPPYPEASKIAFVKQLYCPARIVAAETGCSWELIIAQAAQETGWGEKTLPGTNNIFNIKAAGGWTGPSKEFTVWEKVKGAKVWVVAPFRVYPSIAASLRDRTDFLRKNKGYAKAGLFDAGTKGDFFKEATALKKAGYATDEKYVQLLTDVWNGRTMRRAIEAAKKDGCAAVLPSIEIFFKNGAKAVLAKTKISITVGGRSAEAETDAAGSFVIKLTPDMTGVITLKIFDAMAKKWLDLDPVAIPSPVKSSTVTLVAPTFTVPTSTRVHEKVADAKPAAPAAKPAAPASGPAGGQTKVYKIQKGDTLASIAAAHKMRYKTIADLNNISSPYIIRPDQLLLIPVKSAAGQETGAAHAAAPHAGAASAPAAHAPAAPAPAAHAPAAPAPQQPAPRPPAAPAASAEPAKTAPAAPSEYTTELHAVYYRDKGNKPKTDVMNAMRSPWMKYAEEEFQAKVKRVAGKEANSHIIDYFTATDLNKKMASTDETAWCAAFCNWCLVKAGFKGDNSAGAAVFKNWGRPTRDNKPALGAVALIKFKNGQHHVCFVAGLSKNGKQLATLGGNQGNQSAVTHSHVPIEWVVCYRYPSNYHDYDDDYVLQDVKSDGAPLTAASTHS